jgi:putative ABC transport system substrate-binding protein
VRERCEALVVLLDPNLTTFRRELAAFAARLRIPAVYAINDFVDDGGLLSYSSDQRQLARRAAYYVDRILKGASPADLPMERPTKFELLINLKAADAIGLKIPPPVLGRADRVIQ